MKRIVPIILIFILLIGCSENKNLSRNYIKEYEFTEVEEQLLKDIAVEANGFDISLSEIKDIKELDIFINYYRDGEFVERVTSSTSGDFIDEFKNDRIIWSRKTSPDSDIWSISLDGSISTANINIAEDIESWTIKTIDLIDNIEKDKEYFLAGIFAENSLNKGIKTMEIFETMEEMQENIKSVDIAYVLGIKIE